MSSPGMAPGSATPAPGSSASGIPLRSGVEYRCGDCGARNIIKGGDPVRCRQCGFRILYKTRTKRCTFFYIIVL
jgi:DNA-directed RNA polymerases I, II, and III subunit RPABC4